MELEKADYRRHLVPVNTSLLGEAVGLRQLENKIREFDGLDELISSEDGKSGGRWVCGNSAATLLLLALCNAFTSAFAIFIRLLTNRLLCWPGNGSRSLRPHNTKRRPVWQQHPRAGTTSSRVWDTSWYLHQARRQGSRGQAFRSACSIRRPNCIERCSP